MSKDFTLSFTTKERYKKAVSVLLNNPRYKLIVRGHYLGGDAFGYVTFCRVDSRGVKE